MSSAYFVFDTSAVFSSIQVSTSIIAGRVQWTKKMSNIQKYVSLLLCLSISCFPSVQFFPSCFSCLLERSFCGQVILAVRNTMALTGSSLWWIGCLSSWIGHGHRRECRAAWKCSATASRQRVCTHFIILGKEFWKMGYAFMRWRNSSRPQMYYWSEAWDKIMVLRSQSWEGIETT